MVKTHVEGEKMQEKDEFSDILLEQEDNKTSKAKKMAIFVSVFLLIFIIVLVIMKLLNSSDNSIDQSNIAKRDNAKVVAAAPKEDPLFKQVPIIKDDDKKESFDEWVNRLREKEQQKEKQEQALKAEKSVKKVAQDIPIKNVQQKIVEKKTTKKIQPKKVAQNKTQKSVKKPSKLPTIPIPSSPKNVNKSGNIYIQVLATTKLEPDTKFINKIKTKGFSYRLYKTTIKGKSYLKVLVGPYSSRADAKNSLANVKKALNPKAFIFAIK